MAAKAAWQLLCTRPVNPSSAAELPAEQLVQALPWDTAPRYLLGDRDRIYGEAFRIQPANMKIGDMSKPFPSKPNVHAVF